MSTPPGAADRGSTALPQLITELRDLVVAYFRQETVDPLKSLGVLRLLQVETGTTFHGDWSWAPYLIVFVTLVLSGAITWKARGARRARV